MSHQVVVAKPRKARKMPRRGTFKRKVVSGIKKKKKKPTRSKLVKKLDIVMSTWNRTRFADKNGMVQCYTCTKIAPIKSMQNGHYISRSIRKLRWEPDNMRPQCYGCNVMHGGQVITFRENLVRDLGEDTVRQLEYLRHQLFSPSDEWLRERINFYRQKVDSLL